MERNETTHLTSAEREACFRLGQMDMRASAAAALMDAAEATSGIAHDTMLVAVDLINSLEVAVHD